MIIQKYQSNYKEQLAILLLEYFNELHNDEVIGGLTTASDMIDSLVEDNKGIYLVTDDNDEVLGFVVMYLNNQYNMTLTNVVVEYIYVKPCYRNTTTVLYLYVMIGEVANDYNCDVIGTTLTKGNGSDLAKVTPNNSLLATTYRAPLKDVTYKCNVYKRKLKLN